MTLAAGLRLGPYEILGPMGAGGMGEVYRARDPRLSREVAIKVLPASLSADADRLRRFEQEAKAASALNHPNIVTIHDIGEQDGTLYIAMELVQGTSLREILLEGEPLPVRKTLELATQIAEGLARAHEAGIVHRDLKPENVIVSKDGFVKILDFGLAKLVFPSAEEGSELQTAAPSTHPGTVMGTVGYMSPEQARGRPLDYPSDQFSFGSVVYEMVTGRRAFRRGSNAETLTAIIREEPDSVAQANPRVPAPLRWILERCLAKDAGDRYTSTRDLARDLRSIRDHLSETSLSASSGAPEIAAPVRRTRASRWIPLAAAAALAALGLGYFLGMRRHAPTPSFQQLTYRRGTVLKARFAPDGQTVVYGAAWEGKPVEIFSSRLGSPESRPFGIPGASLFAISSTGELALALGWRYVGNWESMATLARVPLSGGAPRQVLEDVQDADWSPDGKELAVVRRLEDDKRVLEYPIGRRLYETVGWLTRPRVSPDGKTIAVLEHPLRGDNIARVVLVPTSGKSRVLTPVGGVGGVAWSKDGTELWVNEYKTLFRISPTGRRRIVSQVPANGVVEDVSADGRLLLSLIPYRREIVGLAPGETRERNLSWLNWSYPIDLSRDGRQLLFEEQNLGPENAFYIRQTDGSEAVRLGTGRALALSPDGRWALGAAPNEKTQLLLMPTGPGQTRPLRKSTLAFFPNANFLPDGRRFVFTGTEPGRGNRLYLQDLDGDPRAISPEGVTMGRWRSISPDGKRVVALGPDRRIMLYPIDSGEPVAVPGVEPDELPAGWTADGQSLYVAPSFGVPARIHLLEIATGRRTLWKTFDAPDPAGVLRMGPYFISEDGKSYVYSYRREVGDLFLVEGVR